MTPAGSAVEALRAAVSWNGNGCPAAPNASASPSSTQVVHGRSATAWRTSGMRLLMSSRLLE